MYVPTFQGLSAADLVRPVERHEAPFPFAAPRQHRFYRARNAIYHLFQAMQTDRALTVLVPDYNSGNEVLALRATGANLRFYGVGRSTTVDPADIEQLCARQRADVLYVIHYLGWPQPIRPLLDVCRRYGMLLVEDCALSLFSEDDGRPLGSFGDSSIFCLYKTLPVPNGAVLVENGAGLEGLERLQLRQARFVSVAGRTAELVAQRVRSRLNGAGAVLQGVKRTFGRASDAAGIRRERVGDIGFDLGDVDLAMSPVTARLVERVDADAIRERRARNFRALTAALDGQAVFLHRELPAGTCPLFCPLLVPDKPAAAGALRQRGIQVLEFWNQGADQPRTSDERFLRDHVLGLPVHQDLSAEHMAYMAREVARLNLRMAA